MVEVETVDKCTRINHSHKHLNKCKRKRKLHIQFIEVWPPNLYIYISSSHHLRVSLIIFLVKKPCFIQGSQASHLQAFFCTRITNEVVPMQNTWLTSYHLHAHFTQGSQATISMFVLHIAQKQPYVLKSE